MHISEMEIKIKKKTCVFVIKAFETVAKFCILRHEYLSSAANVLANSLKIYDQSKAVFFQLTLPGIYWKKG